MKQDANSLGKAVRNGRGNLLLMLVLTLANILMIYFNATISFPFSAFIPQLIWVICYEFYLAASNSIFLILGVGLCILSLAIYLPFYFLSKKHPVLLIVPLIIFGIDTCCLLWFVLSSFEGSMIIDLLFHVWVLYYLVYGFYAALKIKHLPPASFNPLPLTSDGAEPVSSEQRDDQIASVDSVDIESSAENITQNQPNNLF